jgi:hypothetical protein
MKESTGITKQSIGRGQTIMTATGQDTQSGIDLPNTMGGKMGGSVTNLAHSISGASAVQEKGKGK